MTDPTIDSPSSDGPAGRTRPRPASAEALLALVQEARRGRPQAFEELYARHAPIVHAIAISHVREAEVDDLMQEVFLAAWKRLPRLRDPRAFLPWLTAIARNRARNVRTRRRSHEPLPPELPATRPPDAVLSRDDLRSILQALPETYRETIALRYVEGLSGEEIAAATGLTHGSVRVKLSRGLALLRERLGGRRDE